MRKPKDLENYLTPKKAAKMLREHARDLLRNSLIDTGDLVKLRLRDDHILVISTWNPERAQRIKDAKKS